MHNFTTLIICKVYIGCVRCHGKHNHKEGGRERERDSCTKYTYKASANSNFYQWHAHKHTCKSLCTKDSLLKIKLSCQ